MEDGRRERPEAGLRMEPVRGHGNHQPLPMATAFRTTYRGGSEPEGPRDANCPQPLPGGKLPSWVGKYTTLRAKVPCLRWDQFEASSVIFPNEHRPPEFEFGDTESALAAELKGFGVDEHHEGQATHKLTP